MENALSGIDVSDLGESMTVIEASVDNDPMLRLCTVVTRSPTEIEYGCKSAYEES